MFVFEAIEFGSDDVFGHAAHMLEHLFFFEDVDRCHGCCTRKRVTHVSKTTWVDALFEGVGNFLADDHATKWHIARVDTLGKADEIWCDAPFVDSEPFAATTETGHDFVAHHDDAVFGAQVAHALQVAIGWNQDAVGADDSL